MSVKKSNLETKTLLDGTPTYDVQKQQSIQYPTSDGEGIILNFEFRHNVGHALVKALAKEGFDFKTYFTEDGVPNEKLMQILSNTAHEIVGEHQSFTKKHTIKSAAVGVGSRERGMDHTKRQRP